MTKMYWGLKHGPMNICCEFGIDWFKTKGCRANTRKTDLAPCWPKIGTAEC